MQVYSLDFFPSKKDSWIRYHVPKSVRNFSIITKMEKVGNAHIDWARDNDVSVDEVLASDEFKHLSEAQAKEVVEFVRTLSTVFYSLYKKQYEPEVEIKNNEINNNYEPIKNAA